MALINIYISLFVIPSILIMSLRICSWNSRGVNAAKPYLQELMNENDIVVICEHQLYKAEIFKLNEICRDCDFSLYVNSSKHLVQHRVNNVPGNGGIAICWRTSIRSYVTPIKYASNDRMSIFMLHRENLCPLYIIGVYLPHRSCRHPDIILSYLTFFSKVLLCLI